MDREAISHERIIALALEIADAEGLGALTMRRLAQALGTSPMAAYKYVGSKPELLEAMVEAAMALVPDPDRQAPPAVQLREFFTAMYAALTQHPSAGHVMIARRVAGPITQRRGKHAIRALKSSGLSAAEATTAFMALASFTVGAALVAAVRPSGRESFDTGLGHLLSGFTNDTSPR